MVVGILREEGALGFFRGMASPLLAAAPQQVKQTAIPQESGDSVWLHRFKPWFKQTDGTVGLARPCYSGSMAAASKLWKAGKSATRRACYR